MTLVSYDFSASLPYHNSNEITIRVARKSIVSINLIPFQEFSFLFQVFIIHHHIRPLEKEREKDLVRLPPKDSIKVKSELSINGTVAQSIKMEFITVLMYPIH